VAYRRSAGRLRFGFHFWVHHIVDASVISEMISSSHPTNAAEITSASLYAAIKETLQSGKEPKYRDEDENDAGQRARTVSKTRSRSSSMMRARSQPISANGKRKLNRGKDVDETWVFGWPYAR